MPKFGASLGANGGTVYIDQSLSIEEHILKHVEGSRPCEHHDLRETACRFKKAALAACSEG